MSNTEEFTTDGMEESTEDSPKEDLPPLGTLRLDQFEPGEYVEYALLGREWGSHLYLPIVTEKGHEAYCGPLSSYKRKALAYGLTENSIVALSPTCPIWVLAHVFSGPHQSRYMIIQLDLGADTVTAHDWCGTWGETTPSRPAGVPKRVYRAFLVLYENHYIARFRHSIRAGARRRTNHRKNKMRR